jgi:chaperonin GroES
MKLKPLGDNVVVKPLKEETVKGGIIIPDTATEKTEKGEVIAVGTGKLLENGQRKAMELKAGDKVLYSYSRKEIKIDGEDYCIVSEEDVLAVIQ